MANPAKRKQPSVEELPWEELPNAKEAKAQFSVATAEKSVQIEEVLKHMVEDEMKRITYALKEYMAQNHVRGAFTHTLEGCQVPKKGEKIPSMALERIISKLTAKGYTVTWALSDDGMDYGQDQGLFESTEIFLKRGSIAYFVGNEFDDFDEVCCLPPVILTIDFSKAD